MAAALTISLPVNDASLTRETDGLLTMLDHVVREMPHNSQAYKQYKASLIDLYQILAESKTDLDESRDSLEYLNGTEISLVVQALKPHQYQALRRYRDHLDVKLRLSIRTDRDSKMWDMFKPNTLVWFLINFFHTSDVRKVNNQIITEIKKQSRILDQALSKIDNYHSRSCLPKEFSRSSAQDVWKDRCKAYDYMI